MGKTERSNGAFGKSDIEGKTAREAASELGKERVSNAREHMSECGHERVSIVRVCLSHWRFRERVDVRRLLASEISGQSEGVRKCTSTVSGIRDAPISWYDLRRRKISGSNSRFNSRLESGEPLLVSRHQLRVKMNDRLVTSMVPGEAFDKRRKTFAAILRPGVNAEAVSESGVDAPP